LVVEAGIVAVGVTVGVVVAGLCYWWPAFRHIARHVGTWLAVGLVLYGLGVLAIDHYSETAPPDSKKLCDTARTETGPYLRARRRHALQGKARAITLTADDGSSTLQRNFGADRYAYVWDVSFTASRAIPRRARPGLRIYPRGRFVRGDSAGAFPPLRFGPIHVTPDGREVRLTVCANADAANVEPGAYESAFAVERHAADPLEITSDTVTVKVTAKTPDFIWRAFFPALGAALAGLLLKRWADFQKLNHGVDNANESMTAFYYYVVAPRNIVTGLVAVVTALGTLVAVYSNNPSFGSDYVGKDLVLVVQSAFTAVGLQAVIDGLGVGTNPAAGTVGEGSA
jgi:hypothetical protein